MQGVSC